MCKLRCGTLNFVAGGRLLMHNIVFENDLGKKTGLQFTVEIKILAVSVL